jgi:hypothetical protein
MYWGCRWRRKAMAITEQTYVVKDFMESFGGRSGSAYNNDDAMKRAIEWACSGSLDERPRKISFGAGDWYFNENNILHPATAGVTPSYGPLFQGAGKQFTRFRLRRTADSPKWFYNSDTNKGWNRAKFDGIWFRSDVSNDDVVYLDRSYREDLLGFRIWASTATGGHDKEFIFEYCRFNGLDDPLYYGGSSNTDSTNCYSCHFHACGPIVFDNDQALCNSFYGCHFWCGEDVFHIRNTTGYGQQGKGGGGSIKVVDGDIIMQARDGDTDPHYTLNIYDGAAFYRNWTFDNCKWEFRGAGSRLLKWTGNASFLTGSQVLFTNGCDLSTEQAGTGYGGSQVADVNGIREMIILGPHRKVRMEDAILNTKFSIRFDDVVTGSQVGYASQGVLELDSCLLPWEMFAGVANDLTTEDLYRRLSARITLDSDYGRVIARHCRTRDVTTTERTAMSDWDWNGKNAVRGEHGVAAPTRYYFKTENQGWPVYGSVERTLLLCEGHEIVGMGIDKPDGGSLTVSDVNYQITNDDKTEVYIQTGPFRADQHHRAVANEQTDPQLFPIKIPNPGTRTQRRLRFIQSINSVFSAPVGLGAGNAWVDVR